MLEACELDKSKRRAWQEAIRMRSLSSADAMNALLDERRLERVGSDGPGKCFMSSASPVWTGETA